MGEAASSSNLNHPERPLFPPFLCAGELPRLHWNDPRVAEYLRTARPVVLIGGCPLTKDVVGRWDFDYLSKAYGDHAGLSVHVAPRNVRQFSRFYGKGLGKGATTPMSFDEFVRTASENEARPDPPWRYYMQALLVWSPHSKGGKYSESAGGEIATAAGKLEHSRFGDTSDSALSDDLRHRIDWKWLANALETAESGGIHSCTLWAGYGGGATPMHFDALSNFFTQLVGRKRVLLFPPSQSWNIYPHACDHVKDTYSQVDIENAESADAKRTFPSLSRAKGLECTLEPGDVLWLPSFYWHYVRQHDEGQPNLSVNCWCGAKEDGSTIMGGRASMARKNLASTAAGADSKVEQLLTSSASSAKAAAALVSASSRVREAREVEDERLLGGLPSKGGSPVWAEEVDSAAGLMGLLGGRWLEKEAVQRIKEAGMASWCTVGMLLCAMADGHDALSEEEAVREGYCQPLPPGAKLHFAVTTSTLRKCRSARPDLDGVIGSMGSPGHNVATKLRLDLITDLGVECTCALLRVVTRHGRLHPGIAPKVEGPIVNSEASDYTPKDELKRMLESDGRARSPYL